MHNIIFIRIDRYPELKKELKRIMLDLDIDSYAELLKLFVEMYRRRPLLFREYVKQRSKPFLY